MRPYALHDHVVRYHGISTAILRSSLPMFAICVVSRCMATISSRLSFPRPVFQPFRTSIMASNLRQAVAGIQLDNYMTRTLVVAQASHQSISLFFLVATLTTVGYDYSKSLIYLFMYDEPRHHQFSHFPTRYFSHSSPQYIGI